MNARTLLALFASAGFLTLPLAQANADSGFYVGGSLGSTGIELEIDDGLNGTETFDEDDFSWKLFGGYNFALGDVLTLGVEGAYADLGGPSAEILNIPVGVDATSFNVPRRNALI